MKFNHLSFENINHVQEEIWSLALCDDQNLHDYMNCMHDINTILSMVNEGMIEFLLVNFALHQLCSLCYYSLIDAIKMSYTIILPIQILTCLFHCNAVVILLMAIHMVELLPSLLHQISVACVPPTGTGILQVKVLSLHLL